MQNMSDRYAARGKRPRDEEATMTVDRLTSGRGDAVRHG
jgi:hypothetical protein